MSFNIFWSTEAELNYTKILEYLERKWTIKEIERFIQRLEEVIGHLKKNPNLYRQIKPNTFKAVLTSHVSLIYKVHESNVYLETFWDNRQNPDKLLP